MYLKIVTNRQTDIHPENGGIIFVKFKLYFFHRCTKISDNRACEKIRQPDDDIHAKITSSIEIQKDAKIK